ncbi:MAG: hypothetical protein ACREE3_00530 [Stellaceae bacterium]
MAFAAAAAEAVPPWLVHDVKRKARWLPEAVKHLGLDGAYRERWSGLPPDIRRILIAMRIPRWMIALVPTAPAQQKSILKQLRFMADLAGKPPGNPVARRAEQLLIFGGAAQLPTPGDRVTGASLGAEGCSAAISKYVLAQLKLEFPHALKAMNEALANSQSSDELRRLFEAAARAGIVRVRHVPFARLRAADFLPGSITIAQKPGGTHVFGWTRVPKGWHWYPGDMMAVGNTGLPQFGDHMILAQEYVTPAPGLPGELTHNLHGPINSRDIVYFAGEPDLDNPATNVYAAEASNFILIDLLSPASVAPGA